MSKPLRILHLEDNPSDAHLIQTVLDADGIECEITVVEKADDFISALDKGTVDIILSDYTLPSFDGLTALKIAQTMRPEIPFIFVSGTIGEERAIEAVRRGATDYVVKERLRHISTVVHRALREKEDRVKRIEAENRLRESEERFRALVEHSSDAIAMLDRSGNVIYAGPSTRRVLGFGSEELEGRNWFEMIHTKDRARAMHSLNDVVQSPANILTTQYRVKTKSGEWRWIEATGNNLLNNPGVQAIVFNYRDVTERKLTEDRLAASEASLAAAQRVAHLGSWELDLTNLDDVNVNPLRWSDEVFRIFGYEPGQFEPSNERFFESVHPDDRDGIRNAVAQAIQRGEHYSIEHRIILPDGSERFIHEQSDIVYSGGKPLKMVGIVQDITDRKGAEERLRQSEENYRSLFESARDAIFTIAPNAVITTLNSAFERITGWKRLDWLGRTFSDILHPDDRATAFELFKKVLKGEVPPIQEYRIRKESGEYFIGEFTTTPQIRDDKLVGLLGVVRDVSERKRLEEEIRQAQKMESLGTMAGGIAHDFNNILGIILGYVSIIKGGKFEQTTLHETLDSLHQAVVRGADLVKHILTFARKAEVLMQPTSINKIAEEVSKMVQETFPRTINFSSRLEPGLPMIQADAGQLHQAILNLCINARDAMKKGGDLVISTSKIGAAELRKRFQDALDPDYLCLSVSDQGEGMDEATRQRIFEPFFTTKGAGKGTGLGLSVVFGVIKSHNGMIDVESRPGQGSTFRLYFPVIAKNITSPLDVAASILEIPGGSETILVVEDEEALQALLRTFLEEKGYTVLTASNGAEAVEVFRQHRSKVSLLFTDLGLPKLSGLDAFQRIKKMNPEVKTIFASGFIEPLERQEIAKMGAHAFLQKPYEPAEILRKVREVLDSQ